MRVITLMGADACGKDTQIALLKSHFENAGNKVQVITIWDSLIDFNEVKDKKTLQAIIEIFLLNYEAHARSYFLMSCLKNSLAKMDSSNDIVILNGFFQKYWASEMSYGVESDLWEKNSSEFSVSNIIFYLKAPVSACLSRKVSWSKYEQGLGQFTLGKNHIPKEMFQELLHANLDRIAEKIINHIPIDASRPIEEVFKEIVAKI